MSKIFDFSEKERQKILYREAEKYVKNMNPGVDLDDYFSVEKTFKTKNEIFYQILNSLQNKQMSSNVIGFLNPVKKLSLKKSFVDTIAMKY